MRTPEHWLVLLLALAVSAPPAGAASFSLGYALDNPAGAAGYQFGAAMVTDGSNLFIGAPGNQVAGRVAFAGAVYHYDHLSGTLRHTFVSPRAGYWFGSELAASGPLLAVGEIQGPDSDPGGAVYLFDVATGTLLRSISNPAPDRSQGFGQAVAFVGGNLLVGAPGDDPFHPFEGVGGIAFLFDPASGDLLRTFENPSPDRSDGFGIAVAALGADALVGAPFDDTGGGDAGAAYLFDGATGMLRQTFLPPDPVNRRFGSALATVGSRVLVGAPGDRTPGAAHLFDAVSGALLRSLTSPFVTSPEGFGGAVAARGDDLLVAAPIYGERRLAPDAAFLFSGATGALLHVFVNPAPATSSVFGAAVATVGDVVAVSARQEAGSRLRLHRRLR